MFMIFISHAWVNGNPESSVLELVAALRERGYDTVCDVMLTSQRTSTDFKQMMAESLKKADKVIVILSEEYKKKAEQFSGGVGDEYRYIINDIDVHKKKYLLCTYKEISKSADIRLIVPDYLMGREVLSITKDLQKILYRLNDKDEYKFPDVSSEKEIPESIVVSGKKYRESDEVKMIDGWKEIKNSEIKLLDEKLQSFVDQAICQKRIVPLVRKALLAEREGRREVHVMMLESNEEMRRQFFNCMLKLIDFPNEVVRGEAYYCLGELTEIGKLIDGTFLARGLQDESDFVKACCANVLHRYIPLQETAIDLLKNEITMFEAAEADSSRKRLYYYAKKTLKSHYDYLKLIM